MTATSVPARGGTALKRDAIGLPEVLFQSITHMAPAVATALSIGAATGFALKLTPLAVVFAMVACLFTAYSIGSWGGTCRRRAACTRTSRTAWVPSSDGWLPGRLLLPNPS